MQTSSATLIGLLACVVEMGAEANSTATAKTTETESHGTGMLWHDSQFHMPQCSSQREATETLLQRRRYELGTKPSFGLTKTMTRAWYS